LDNFGVEDQCVRALAPYAANIPADLMPVYVSSIAQTYVGHFGGSARWSRTDFYANGAATEIPTMFEACDDTASAAFVECIRKNSTLRRRIDNPVKLNRLRSLANIVLGRVSAAFPHKKILEALVDEAREDDFWTLLRQG
jgi:hypothetical protein